MKKLARTLCMMAVVALAFTSCNKDKKDDVKTIALNSTTEQFVNVYDEDDLDKVYLDDALTVHFDVGDQIGVFNIYADDPDQSQAMLYTVDESMHLQTAWGTLAPNTTGNYYAFYPGQNATANVSLIHNENRAVFRLDPEQDYRVDDDGNVMVPLNALYMAAKDETHQVLNDVFFNFKNICGMLSLKFFSPSGKSVESITVTDKKFNLVGDVTLKIHEIDPVYLTDLFNRYSDDDAYQAELWSYLGPEHLGYAVSGDIRNNIKLNCGGVELGTTKSTATRFFIVMRPLALLEGCTIDIEFTDGTHKVIPSSKNNIISPNVIRNIAPVNVG